MPSSCNDLIASDAAQLRAAFASRTASPVELIAALSARIAATEPVLNAFTTLCLEAAADAARAAERAFAPGGEPRPLEGIPLAVKDFFDTAGVRTTVGSPIFGDRVPTADAEAVRRARAAGAIVIGKTATHEFGWGITTDSAHFGPTRNPWDPARVPGGSSGGSAAALASFQAPLAIGSDTGGSIRIPAAFCGVVGIKPTWGRVSCAGAFPLAPSLDHPGAMARTPADAALLLGVLGGRRPGDGASWPAPGDAATSWPGAPGDPIAGAERLTGVRVALCPDLHTAPLPDAQRAAYDDAARTLGELGAELVTVAFPGAERILPTFATIQQAEAAHTHRTAGLYPERADEYGDDVRGRLEAAQRVGLGDYLDALEERRRIAERFDALFAAADLLLTPVAAASPVRIGETAVAGADGAETPFRDLVMPYTVPQDVAGLPACAVRAGFDPDGLPIGVQLTGPVWAEERVLTAAQALHRATEDLQRRWPASPAAAA